MPATTATATPVPAPSAPRAPRAPASLTGAGGGAPRRGPSAVGRLLAVLVVVVLLLQRVVLPVGGDSYVPVVLAVQYLVVLPLVAARLLRADRLRGELLLGAAVLVVAATLATSLTGAGPSTTSLGLLLAVYLPWCLSAPRAGRADLELVGRTFLWSALVLAVVGVLQLTGQLTGTWTFEDYVADVIPPDWLYAKGVYNFTNPLTYGSPVFKGNAFVLLEPSFLSQFCALAVIVGLVLRVRTWQLLVLLAGVASAVSGTGIILLGAGAVLVLVRAPRLLRPGFLVALAAVVVAALLSPVAGLLTARAGETSEEGSSGYLRFVQPYTEVARGLEADHLRLLVGAGSGAADRLLASSRGGQLGEAVVYTVAPKLLFEYGLVAGGAFTLFVVLALLDRAPWRVVPGVVVVMLMFLSGSLLQPQTTIIAWLLTGVWAGLARSEVHERHGPGPGQLPAPATTTAPGGAP